MDLVRLYEILAIVPTREARPYTRIEIGGTFRRCGRQHAYSRAKHLLAQTSNIKCSPEVRSFLHENGTAGPCVRNSAAYGGVAARFDWLSASFAQIEDSRPETSRCFHHAL
jgi:hypothetical protein